MTPDELRQRLEADFRVAHAVRQSERPEGLTASRLLNCMSEGARILLGEPQGSDGEVYRGLRGTWVHNGLADDLNLVDPDFVDGRGKRFAWNPGGGLPVITGEYDFLVGDAAVEVKTRPRDECRWHADHGAAPEHSAQVSAAAASLGLPEAFVVYLPTDAGVEEMAVCAVDVDHWTAEARHWLWQVDVRAEVEAAVERGVPRPEAVRRVLDAVPRDKPVQWCAMFCVFAKDCRGDYVSPEPLEIQDPVMRAAAQEADHWRQVRLDAARREKAAKSKLAHAEGTVHVEGGEVIRLDRQTIAPNAGRRGHTRTKVERRSD